MKVVYTVSKDDTCNPVKMAYLLSLVDRHVRDDRFVEVTVRRTGR